MLPIDTIVDELIASLQHTDVVLSAPPGAGKSTYLPLKLLLSPHIKGQIIMLQPRQVAVRSIAEYLAHCLGEAVGKTIGYQMRGDAKSSQDTRLLIVTQGVLQAKLRQDPQLSGVALVIFDEFHERNIYSDIGLGLCQEVQQGWRDDLRLLVMSATLEGLPLQRIMPDAKHLRSSGRAYPVDIIYRPMGSQTASSHYALEHSVCALVKECVQSHGGNILVFLPGQANIRKVHSLLQAQASKTLLIAPLFGGLSSDEQQLAIAPPAPDQRKVVLATNIAETSLTIDGVSVVIDSGSEKVQRFNLARKANQLSTQMISKSSSTQRAGRAGRQQAGVCYRLWTQEKQQVLVEQAAPEITQADITAHVLFLLDWGTDFSQLSLLDRPSQAQLAYAFSLLRGLAFVDAKHDITALGREAASLSCEPRLAAMLLHAKHYSASVKSGLPKGEAKSLLQNAALAVALLEAKPLSYACHSIDLEQQLNYLLKHPRHDVWIQAKRWYKKVISQKNQSAQAGEWDMTKGSFSQQNITLDLVQAVLLYGFSDQLAWQKNEHAYLQANGMGVAFSEHETALRNNWVLVLSSSVTKQANNLVRLFIELAPDLLQAHLDKVLEVHEKQYWDARLQKVQASQQSCVGAIVLKQMPIAVNYSKSTQAIVLEQLKQGGLSKLLAANDSATELLARLSLAAEMQGKIDLDLPMIDMASLLKGMNDWLLPFLDGVSTWSQLEKLDYHQMILNMLNWQQQQEFEAKFPRYFEAPTGNKHRLHYTASQGASLAIRMQELYGLDSHPSICAGQVPLTLSLLSPAQREIQKTRDLVGFWRGSYQQVQKEMKGRYPKHFWPDTPQNAAPTTRTKAKM